MKFATWSSVVSFLVIAVVQSAIAQAPLTPMSTAPLVPLYVAHAPQSTDHFYTIDFGDYTWAINNGFIAGGVVAYLEGDPTGSLNGAPNTLPFKRFYSAARTDHFYSWRDEDEAYVLQNGWVAEGNEGWIYVTQVPGSLPLYRLNKTDHVTGDHDHYYTLSYTEVQGLLQSGWALDGVAGYAYSSPSPTVAGGVVLGNRPWLPGSDPRAKAFGAFYGPEYPRQSRHARTQLVSFRMTSYGLAASQEHVAVMLRAAASNSGWLVNNYYYWGAGIAFGALHYECSATGPGPQLVAIELFDNPQINRVFGLGDTPNTCAPTLPEGTPVDVLVSVNDAAQVSFEYRVNGVLFGYGTVNVGGFDGWTPYSGYKLGATGVVITPSTGALQPYTVYIENLQVAWIQ